MSPVQEIFGDRRCFLFLLDLLRPPECFSRSGVFRMLLTGSQEADGVALGQATWLVGVCTLQGFEG